MLEKDPSFQKSNEFIRDEVMSEIFENSVIKFPHHHAIEFQSRIVTYSELNTMANRLAHYMRLQFQIQKGDRVGIWMKKSPELFATILGVLKAGGTYVPMDPEYPRERVQHILHDSQSKLLITSLDTAEDSLDSFFPCPLMSITEMNGVVKNYPAENLSPELVQLSPDDSCYIIYTSGSTGLPKGVELTHRNVCHLIRAEAELYQLNSQDRIYQGFSVAFDASVEEIWQAFFHGATLFVADEELRRGGPDFAKKLSEEKITVLSWVPSMLATLREDIPSLRLIIVGGEVCPNLLVDKWAKEGRRFINTYGPTEATVIATACICTPGKNVTIGRPLVNYGAHILDEDLKPVPDGEAGELCLSGVGLAKGYVNRPDLTAKSFVEEANLPFLKGSGIKRIYRTGDLVKKNSEGELLFLGRKDSQIKLRGFRIELQEVESTITKDKKIENAVVSLREDRPGHQFLAAYITLNHHEGPFDLLEFKNQLKKTLPPYMVPATFTILEEFPLLSSGKINRKNLPAPEMLELIDSDQTPAETLHEVELEKLMVKLFNHAKIGIHQHFFNDLNGDSFLAATFASDARSHPLFQNLSIADIYHFPTIHQLAKKLEETHLKENTMVEEEKEKEAVKKVSTAQYLLCSLGQLMGLYPVVGIYGFQWVFPYVIYRWFMNHGFGLDACLFACLLSVVFLYPIVMLVALVGKWCLIGRFKAGRYPLWGSYYLRWWLVRKLLDCVPFEFMAGTPFLSLYYRLLGAKVGKNVIIQSTDIFTYDLISIGDNATISSHALLLGSTVVGNELILGSITLKDYSRVGTCAVVGINTEIGEGGDLDDQSLLADNQKIPSFERFHGSPATFLNATPPIDQEKEEKEGLSWLRKTAMLVVDFIALSVIPLFSFSVILPGMMLIMYFHEKSAAQEYLVLAPFVALSFVIIFSLQILFAKKLLLGKIRPGTYSTKSFYYLKKNFVDRLMSLSLEVVGSLYSTIYLNPWYRLMGAKIGKGTEISTITNATPDLIEIGEESFIADAVSFGATYYNRGHFTLAKTKIGARSFMGNSAHIPLGHEIGPRTLIGVLSVPPNDLNKAKESGLSWLGSPAVYLPLRTTNNKFSEEQTFRPKKGLIVARAMIEFLRVILPTTIFIVFTCLMLTLLHDVFLKHLGIIGTALVFPFLYSFFGVAAAAVVVMMKWVLIGTYHEGERPLWSSFIWRTEFLTAMHENFADPFLMQLLTGTPFISWFFRALGSKIGKRVYLDTTYLTEFDLIQLGDGACVNTGATLQTHLFEDRVMKMGRVHVADGATVGMSSVVLYNSFIGEKTILGDLSLLMKREHLPPKTHWEGIPAKSYKKGRP